MYLPYSRTMLLPCELDPISPGCGAVECFCAGGDEHRRSVITEGFGLGTRQTAGMLCYEGASYLVETVYIREVVSIMPGET
jgi:hypothetical protein